jgi:hypothetical protein
MWRLKTVVTTSFLGPLLKRAFLISPCAEEATLTVPTRTKKATSLNERIAVIETTALIGKLALGGLAGVVLGLFSFFYTNVIPDKVEQGISNSTSLNAKFSDIREDVKKLDGRFEQLISTIRPLVSPKIVSAALRDSASSDRTSLPTALIEIRNLLAVARDMKVPLRGKDYLHANST